LPTNELSGDREFELREEPLKVTLFADNWFHEMIHQVLEKHIIMTNEKPRTEALLVAEAIMTAGAMIAQAIEHGKEKKDG
jgi:hypothetical protein